MLVCSGNTDADAHERRAQCRSPKNQGSCQFGMGALLIERLDQTTSRTRRGGGVEEIAGLVDFRSRESSHLEADCIMRDAVRKEGLQYATFVEPRGIALALL
jgi:hypothetical protein